MSNEIIKYGPELNTIPLRKFSPVEMNLFFSIVSRMRNKGTQTVRFTFDQLKELSDYKPTANNRFEDDIQRTYTKLIGLHFGKYSHSGLNRDLFVMFTKFQIRGDTESPYVDIEIYKDALPLLNNLDTWVRYALTEFRNLHSGYAKTAFRNLKGFRTTGYAYFTKDKFFELFDIPRSYWKKTANVDQFVLKPIKEELTPLFRGLTIRKKYGKGRGKPVIGYAFAWKAERKDAEDVHISKQQRLNEARFNIEHNTELSDKEKWRALDKIRGVKLGTTEQEYLNQKQKEHDEEVAKIAKQEVLEQLKKNWRQ
ncbi:replication initiation protein [Lacticaseibacillus paracasei]|uniref:replication initiation protein n=1 Tax=Lacticaseibacillus paracasei TaxID=1597 RepID=UPI003D08892F